MLFGLYSVIVFAFGISANSQLSPLKIAFAQPNEPSPQIKISFLNATLHNNSSEPANLWFYFDINRHHMVYPNSTTPLKLKNGQSIIFNNLSFVTNPLTNDSEEGNIEEEKIPWMTPQPFSFKVIAIDKNKLLTQVCNNLLGNNNLSSLIDCIRVNNATHSTLPPVASYSYNILRQHGINKVNSTSFNGQSFDLVYSLDINKNKFNEPIPQAANLSRQNATILPTTLRVSKILKDLTTNNMTALQPSISTVNASKVLLNETKFVAEKPVSTISKVIGGRIIHETLSSSNLATATHTSIPTAVAGNATTSVGIRTSTGIHAIGGGSFIPGFFVIDFENLLANGWGSGSSTPVYRQYAESMGIIINHATVIDYSAFSSNKFAHSGNKAIEMCYGKEFCNDPLEVQFASPQKHIKLWLGYSGRLTAPNTLVLRAYDASGQQLIEKQIILGANENSQAVNIPLEVDTPERTIHRMTLSSAHGSMSNVVIDDLEFDNQGIAQCDASEDPRVSIDPLPQTSSQFNEFALGGFIVTPSKLEEVDIVTSDDNGNTKSTNILGPTNIVHEDGGRFGPIRFDEFLFEGKNTLFLQAKNCHGTSKSLPVSFTYTPISSDARFKLLGLEIVQDTSVGQKRFDDNPIAARPTLIRAYLSVQGADKIKHVSGVLYGYKPGYFNPDRDLRIISIIGVPSINTVDVDSSTDIEAKKRNFASTLLFSLPPELTTSRRINFQVKPVIEAELGTSLGISLKCDSTWRESQSTVCENLDQNDRHIFADFKGPIMSDQLISLNPDQLTFGTEAARKIIEDGAEIGPAYQSGCHNGGVEGNDRSEPEWPPVDGHRVLNTVYGTVARGAVLARDDNPYTHDSHDVNIDVVVDPNYQNAYSSTNKMVDYDTVMETEWEMGNHNDGSDDRFFHEFWPTAGDKVWMMGRWVYDCGHVGAYIRSSNSSGSEIVFTGPSSELHPILAIANTRQEPVTFSGASSPSLEATKTYFYLNGEGGYRDLKSDYGLLRDYEFDIPLPKKPTPTSQLKFEVLDSTWGRHVGAPSPIKMGLEEGDNPKIHVKVPLSLNNIPFVFDWDNALGVDIQNVRGLFKKMAGSLYPNLDPEAINLFDRANVRSVDANTIIAEVHGISLSHPLLYLGCTIRISDELKSAVGNCSDNPLLQLNKLNNPSYQLVYKVQDGRKKIFDPGNIRPQYKAIIAAGWSDEAPVNTYRNLRVTMDSLQVNNNHYYGILGHDPTVPVTWYLWISINGHWFSVPGLSRVVDGQSINLGTSFDVTVPDNGKLVIKSTGFKRAPIDDLFYVRSEYKCCEDISELSGLDDWLFNCLNHGPVCGGISLGMLNLEHNRSFNFGIGRPLTADSSISDEDNIDGKTDKDFTLRYHIDQIS